MTQMPSEEEPYVCTLPEDIQKLAQDELNENPNTRDQSIKTLRAWILANPHIKARTGEFRRIVSIIMVKMLSIHLR